MLVRKQLEDQRVSCGDGRDDVRTLITPLGERDEVLMRDIGLKRDAALCDFAHLRFGTVMVDCGEEDGGTNVVSDNQHISNETIPFVPSLRSLIQSLQADINMLECPQQQNGWVPVHYTVVYGHLTRLTWLLKQCSKNKNKINTLLDQETFSSSSNWTPLMLCCALGRFEIAYHLIGEGANFHQKDNGGKNVLHYAVESGSLGLLSFQVTC